MFRKNRNPIHDYYDEDYDSAEMEANYDEIEREEYKSRKLGALEDKMEW